MMESFRELGLELTICGKRVLKKMLRTEKTHKKNPFSLFFIMVLVVIISVSAGFSFFYYNVYNHSMRNELISKRASELQASEQYLDNLFSALTRQMNSLMFTKEIYLWDDATADYKDYHTIMEILRENKAKHSAIHSIYVVFEEKNLVLTSNEGYFSLEHFYDDTWELFGTDQIRMLDGTDKVGITGSHRLEPRSLYDTDVVSLVGRIRVREGQGKSDGYMVFNLAKNKIVQVIDAQSWEGRTGEQELAILAEDNSVIYDNTKGLLDYFTQEDIDDLKKDTVDYLSRQIDGQTWLCQKICFENTGWYILRISRMTEEEASVVWAKNVMTIALIIGLFAIGGVLILIWKQVYLPYARLTEKLKKGDKAFGNVESMEYLEEMIARTLDTKELLLESYFERVLLGAYKGAEKPDNKIIRLNEFGLLLIQKNERASDPEIGHAVANVQLTALKSCIKQYMVEEQNDISVKECYCVGMTDMRVAVILEMEEEIETETMGLCLQMLLRYISGHQNIDISIGISKKHTGAEKMNQAYLEAKEALGIHYFYPEQNLFYYGRTSQLKRDFYIENSVKVDMFTSNLYRMNIEEAKETLGIILTDIKRELVSVIYYNLPNFFSRIFERIYRAVRNMGQEPKQFFDTPVRDNDNYFNTWEFETMEEAIGMLYRMLDQLQAYQQEQGNAFRKANKQWAKVMLEYVEQNYDKGISLTQMAEDLGLDESYLSKQFKEKVGVSFVQYVTKCRMDKAKELLKDSSMKLADIAETLGMGNVQSFIRTFKKYEGMTPGQYRESNLTSE